MKIWATLGFYQSETCPLNQLVKHLDATKVNIGHCRAEMVSWGALEVWIDIDCVEWREAIVLSARLGSDDVVK